MSKTYFLKIIYDCTNTYFYCLEEKSFKLLKKSCNILRPREIGSFSFDTCWNKTFVWQKITLFNSANCGKGHYVTWVLYYGVSAGAPITCENYNSVKTGSNSEYSFVEENTDYINDISYCVLTERYTIFTVFFHRERKLSTNKNILKIYNKNKFCRLNKSQKFISQQTILHTLVFTGHEFVWYL